MQTHVVRTERTYTDGSNDYLIHDVHIDGRVIELLDNTEAPSSDSELIAYAREEILPDCIADGITHYTWAEYGWDTQGGA